MKNLLQNFINKCFTYILMNADIDTVNKIVQGRLKDNEGLVNNLILKQSEELISSDNQIQTEIKRLISTELDEVGLPEEQLEKLIQCHIDSIDLEDHIDVADFLIGATEEKFNSPSRQLEQTIEKSLAYAVENCDLDIPEHKLEEKVDSFLTHLDLGDTDLDAIISDYVRDSSLDVDDMDKLINEYVSDADLSYTDLDGCLESYIKDYDFAPLINNAIRCASNNTDVVSSVIKTTKFMEYVKRELVSGARITFGEAVVEEKEISSEEV